MSGAYDPYVESVLCPFASSSMYHRQPDEAHRRLCGTSFAFLFLIRQPYLAFQVVYGIFLSLGELGTLT